MKDELKPCPFCGFSDLIDTGWSERAIRCLGCGAIGPTAKSKVLGFTPNATVHRELWNERRALREPPRILKEIDDDPL